MADFIRWIRERVGHARILLHFAEACVTDGRGWTLPQKRSDSSAWGPLGGRSNSANPPKRR